MIDVSNTHGHKLRIPPFKKAQFVIECGIDFAVEYILTQRRSTDRRWFKLVAMPVVKETASQRPFSRTCQETLRIFFGFNTEIRLTRPPSMDRASSSSSTQ